MTFSQQVTCARQMSWQAISLPWQNKKLTLRLALLYLPIIMVLGGLAAAFALYMLRQGANVALELRDKGMLLNFVLTPLLVFFCAIPGLRFIFGVLDGQEISWRQAFSFDRSFVLSVLPLVLFLPVLQFAYQWLTGLLVPSVVATAPSLQGLSLASGLTFLLVLLVYWFFFAVLYFAISIRIRRVTSLSNMLTTAISLMARNMMTLTVSVLLLTLWILLLLIVAAIVGSLLYLLVHTVLALGSIVFAVIIAVLIVPVIFYFLATVWALWAVFVKQLLSAQQ